MRIALLTQGFRPEVAEASNITLRMLAKQLLKEGHDVTIFCSQIFKQPRVEKYEGIKIIRGSAKYGTMRYLLQDIGFTDTIRKSGKEFDVIHNFSSSPLLAMRGILAKRYSKDAKLVQTIKARTTYPFTYLLTPLMNMYDTVTVPTRFLKDTLVGYGLASSRIQIVPSYIDTEKFKPRSKDTLKRKHGYYDQKVLLYYGHLSEQKGISYLIDAIEILQDTDFIALFVTGSTEPHIRPYEEMIRRKGLQHKIKILRTTKHVEEFVNLADAVVLPYPDLTSTEAQPSCILETMASKTPLLTTDLPEIREFLTEQEAVFAQPRDSEKLAVKIKSVLGDYPRKRLEVAYKKSQQFRSKKIIKKYIELYK